MSGRELLLAAGVSLCGGVGATLRFLLARVVQKRAGSPLPWGTWLVNAAGCLLLGMLAELALPSTAAVLLGTGLLGGFTTYSTFNLETLELLRQGARFLALANLALTLVGCALSGWAGMALGHALRVA